MDDPENTEKNHNKSKMIKISVIIPLYNKAKSIRRTLSSVLNQTYKDFELIVVDDGSTDDGSEIVKSIDDDRIRVFRKQNGGVSSARNYGVKLSNHDLVTFLDADDLWEKDYLKNLASMREAYPMAGMYAQAYDKIFNNGSIESPDLTFMHGKRELLIDKYENYVLKYPLICASSIAIDKSLFISAGCFDEKLSHGEDLELWFRLAMMKPFVYNGEVTAHYMFGDQLNTHLKLPKVEKFFSYKMISNRDLYLDIKDNFMVRRVLNTYILYGYIYYKSTDKNIARFFRKKLAIKYLNIRGLLQLCYYSFLKYSPTQDK